ncbi:hypothetical protein J0S82_001020, partial [Galemys pyrenaicus]
CGHIGLMDMNTLRPKLSFSCELKANKIETLRGRKLPQEKVEHADDDDDDHDDNDFDDEGEKKVPVMKSMQDSSQKCTKVKAETKRLKKRQCLDQKFKNPPKK